MSVWIDTNGRAIVLAHVMQVGAVEYIGQTYECFRVMFGGEFTDVCSDLENQGLRSERVVKTASAKREELIAALREWHERPLNQIVLSGTTSAGGLA